MNSNEWAEKITQKLGEAPPSQEIKRYVDIDISSSFAHQTANLTIDEIFGYKRLAALKQRTEANILSMDYDLCQPSKEKPDGRYFETALKEGNQFIRPLLFQEGNIPFFRQPLRRDLILRELDRDWEQLCKRNNYSSIGMERVNILLKILREAVPAVDDTRSFLRRVRSNYLAMLGIESMGTPESTMLPLYAQKLREDLDAGFPFWEMDLPPEFEAKHKSIEGTFLFYSVNADGSLAQVQFSKEREYWNFQMENEKITLDTEQAFQAMSEGRLIPTLSLLSYIGLSPARKRKDNERKKRAHLGGFFMAGENGYGHRFLPYFNKISGFDEVLLLCTDYDGRCKVQDKQRSWISIGAVFPHFGQRGLEQCLEGEEIVAIERGKILEENETRAMAWSAK
ncbi:hypothetical protein HZA98_01055 [Candidatus Woesearchaeota archaeon]|nr:hypothetical protein [Candidatus Woesearchaeota archaeon]